MSLYLAESLLSVLIVDLELHSMTFECTAVISSTADSSVRLASCSYEVNRTGLPVTMLVSQHRSHTTGESGRRHAKWLRGSGE